MLISCCGCGRIHCRRVGDAAEEAFRALYTDPVRVNGALLTAADMVARARALQLVFDRPERKVLDVLDGGGKVAVAFQLRWTAGRAAEHRGGGAWLRPARIWPSGSSTS